MRRDLFVDTDEVVLLAVTTCRTSFVTLGLPCSTLITGLAAKEEEEKSVRIGFHGCSISAMQNGCAYLLCSCGLAVARSIRGIIVAGFIGNRSVSHVRILTWRDRMGRRLAVCMGLGGRIRHPRPILSRRGMRIRLVWCGGHGSVARMGCIGIGRRLSRTGQAVGTPVRRIVGDLGQLSIRRNRVARMNGRLRGV